MSANSSLNRDLEQTTPIYDITPFSALDFPDHLSAIIWFAGCNMRCDYCYNSDIVFSKGQKSLTYVLNFLKTRRGMLEGVVLSGGEATQFDGLVEFAQDISALGFKIKLDTNGTNPDMIKALLDKGLLDYCALDYKAPKEKFYEITKNRNFDAFEKSLSLLIESEIEFEVRTTVHRGLLDESDINLITKDLEAKSYKGIYYIQNFVEDVKTIGGISNPEQSLERSKIESSVEISYR